MLAAINYTSLSWPLVNSVYLHRIYDKWYFDLDSLSLQENNYVNKVLNKLHIHDSNLVDKVIEYILLGKDSIRIISESNRSDIAESNKIRLRSLYRTVTQIERETGLQETYWLPSNTSS